MWAGHPGQVVAHWAPWYDEGVEVDAGRQAA